MAHQLITDNPYRVLGTGSRVSAQVLSNYHHALMEKALKGEDIKLGQDLSPLLGEPLRTPYRLDQAKLRLSSAKSRLYHALFWFIDTCKSDHAAICYMARGDYARAENLLRANPRFSSYINLAVLYFIQERFQDAMNMYTACFRDDDMAAAFVASVIGDRFKVRGSFLLARAVVAVEQELKRLRSEDSADERGFAGAGSGVRNKESQNRVRLVSSVKPRNLGFHLQLKKQARNFDRHLSEAFDDLMNKIADINRSYGIEEDDAFIPVGPGANPAAGHVLDALIRFFNINGSLICAFRDRCVQSGERSLYTDYAYNVVSLCNYALHLYAIDLGRMFSQSLLQRLRSLLARISGLFFRIKSEDGEFLIASMKRLEDVLPYIHDLSEGFNRLCTVRDPKLQMSSFKEYLSFGRGVLDNFSNSFSLRGGYTDCSMHLQNALVLFSVSFIADVTGIALCADYKKRPETLKNMVEARRLMDLAEMAAASNLAGLNSPDAVNDDHEVQPAADKNAKGPEDAAGEKIDASSANEPEASAASASADGSAAPAPASALPVAASASASSPQSAKRVSVEKGLSKKELKRRAAAEKSSAERYSAVLRKHVVRERKYLYSVLDRFENFTVSPSTMTLIKVVRMQLDRLPPPLSAKTALLLLLPVIAGALVALNMLLERGALF